MKLKHFVFIFLLSIAVLVPSKVQASEYFDTSYEITYDVSESGIADATIDVTLTNTTSDYYASSYKVQVGFPQIENVTGVDSEGQLEPRVTQTPDGNIIEAEFNEQVVGQGNSLDYSINFQTPNIAQKHGSIWEINIPGISEPENFDEFTVTVNVPESFGKPTYIKPYQGGDTDTTFTKDQLGTSGISIAYGTEQIYAFDLSYHLENPNIYAVQTEIALPPTTNYQEVYIQNIDPRPQNVTMDQDGNWMAHYALGPAEKKDVKVKGHALVSLIPKKQPMTEAQLDGYLNESKYWEVTDPEIVKVAKELQTPRNIYNYLVSELSYDFTRVEENSPRLGGIATLENKESAVCLEFTDLFITLARAAGIPAREVDGYAHTENERQRPLSLAQDILHAWPEYYDRELETWIMVDPTWGNTTGGVDYFDVFDFDHLTFVIKGYDSEYPVPAGGYKYTGQETVKDVSISFNPSFVVPDSKLSFQLNTKESYFSALPIDTVLSVANAGEGLSTPTNATIQSRTLSPHEQTKELPHIPPFGHVTVPVTFDKQPFLTNGDYDFTILIAGESVKKDIRVKPIFYSTYVLAGGGGILVLLAIGLFIIARRTRRISVS